jgi:hypothetical protein
MWEETSLEVVVERLLVDEPTPRGHIYQRRKTYLCTATGGQAAPGYEPEADAQTNYAITAVQWLDLRNPASWQEVVVADSLTYPQLLRLREVLGYAI